MKSALEGVSWLHITGITPAISEKAFKATLALSSVARKAGVTVSCDLNFRKKLWRWDPDVPSRELAERTMRKLLPLVDVVIANEEDCGDVLQIRAADTDVHAGRLAVDRYPEVARRLIDAHDARIKPILVGGSYLDLMKAWRVRVYFDQHGALTRQLGIAQVPAIVSQEGLRLRIDEVVL